MVYQKKARNSNIEILRVISIFLIIMGHMVSQSGIFDNLAGKVKFTVLFMGSASRIAVNIFLIIGVWFMVDSDFKSSRIIKLYSELFLYSVTITLIMMLLGRTEPTKDLLRGLMPFLGRALWFVSAYICLIALSPYLKLILDLPQKKLTKLTIILFIMICFVSSLPDAQMGYVVDSLFFPYVYICIGFYKKYIHKKIKKRVSLFVGIIGLFTYIALVMAHSLIYIKEIGERVWVKAAYKLSTQYLNDIKTIPNFFCALCIFIFFINMHTGRNKYINRIAKPVFAIYIIHQVPLFYPFLWNDIFKCPVWPQNYKIIIYIIIVSVIIYLACGIIDYFRTQYLEPIWMKSKLYIRLVKTLDRFM